MNEVGAGDVQSWRLLDSLSVALKPRMAAPVGSTRLLRFTSIVAHGVRLVMQVGALTEAAHAVAPASVFVNSVIPPGPGAWALATNRSGLLSPVTSPRPMPLGSAPGTSTTGSHAPQGGGVAAEAVLPKQPRPLPRNTFRPSLAPWLSSTTAMSG